MFTSAAFRDSKRELQLNTSIWRLSWITFIFLPLTFMVGFFGINVDTFQPSGGFPSLKWYFISSAPLMVTVIVMYMLLRSNEFEQEDDIHRTMYEMVFTQFSEVRPDLFSRYGPRQRAKTSGAMPWLKWCIIRFWFNEGRLYPSKRVREIEALGLWTRIKRFVAYYWLSGIYLVPDIDPLSSGFSDVEPGDLGTISQVLAKTTPIAAASASTAIQRGIEPSIRGGVSHARSERSSNEKERKPLDIMTYEESSNQDLDETDYREQSNDGEQASRENNKEK